MGIPNEHQLKFNCIKDAKQLLEAIEKRFGGNAAIKKTQRNLFKQQYKNFTALNSEILDQTFDELQKLEQIHPDDMEEMDLRWQMAMLTMRASREYRAPINQDTKHKESTRRIMLVETPASVALISCDGLAGYDWIDQVEERPNYALMAYTSLCSDSKQVLKKTRRKLTVNGNETLDFDMSKVECYNCHKRGHFAREYRAPINQDTKHKESTRRIILVETPASVALISCDGLAGYDWIDQVEERPNYALMAYTSLCSDSK
nr:ribonuclease H-like domain-containing protein [Tanacetum cinerariifolium]